MFALKLQNFAKSVFEGGSKPITMRFVTAIDLVDSSKTEALSRELWMRVWSRVRTIVRLVPYVLQYAGTICTISTACTIIQLVPYVPCVPLYK